MQKLSRKVCADLLGISLSTFERRVKKGIYGAGVKTGDSQTAERWFSYADIGLPEPQEPEPSSEEIPRTLPEPCNDVLSLEPCVSESETEPTCEELPRTLPEPSDLEIRQLADLEFADAYRRGEATDSLGNTVNGSNDRFPVSGQATLLGPAVRELPPTTPRTGTSHMKPELLSDYPRENPISNPQLGAGSTNDGSPLAAGYSQDAYNADMEDWRKRNGAPSMSQQREAIERSQALIHAAFPRGR